MIRRAMKETMNGTREGPVLAFASTSDKPRAATHCLPSTPYQTAPKAKPAMAAMRSGRYMPAKAESMTPPFRIWD
jgi:hypothetical protein